MDYFAKISSSERVFCPNCPPVYNRRGNRIGEVLKCTERNYSGCFVDIAYCEKCENEYEISYKVDKVKKID